MPVFHCPLCPLIFQYRTEVEWHLRNEHRSRVEEEDALAAQLAAVGQDLDRERLRALQASQAGPAVTLLMATTPGPSMTSLDIARLRRLASQARRRLAAEPGVRPANLETRLARAVAAAEGAPTHSGLALLVNAQELAIFHLPFGPADRAVVDPSFATRDLETTLQRYPRYRLLVLGRHPRLLEGRGLSLAEVAGADPRHGNTTAAGSASFRPAKRSVRPERWTLGRARRRAGIQVADALLSHRVDINGDLPLVIAGDGRWRADFRRQSPHAGSVVGDIPGIRSREPASRLAARAQPHLARRLHDTQAAAVAELERANSGGSIAWGLPAAWAAVHGSKADLLWVEQNYARPGRPAQDGETVRLAHDPEQPGVIDDLVDDLIEAAIAKGVAVHLLADGTINKPEPVAARLRKPSNPALPAPAVAGAA